MTKDSITLIGAGAIILITLTVIVLFPLVFIWSLNTLFASLVIPYNIWTYLAALFFNFQLFGDKFSFKI